MKFTMDDAFIVNNLIMIIVLNCRVEARRWLADVQRLVLIRTNGDALL